MGNASSTASLPRSLTTAGHLNELADLDRRVRTRIAILDKESAAAHRLREQRLRTSEWHAVRAELRDARQANAAARRLYRDYVLQFRARMSAKVEDEESVSMTKKKDFEKMKFSLYHYFIFAACFYQMLRGSL
ncbi:unnamed protein product [Protopolystoma xenopodis]|uniref:Uncharacterized protein n=1 Tax=Protopolystoma xenopodis TaxID=117903 RepID=A0A3S5CM74_9PLAT|nr:unnamed protein product [Protopolystoma xenopodis]